MIDPDESKMALTIQQTPRSPLDISRDQLSDKKPPLYKSPGKSGIAKAIRNLQVMVDNSIEKT